MKACKTLSLLWHYCRYFELLILSIKYQLYKSTLVMWEGAVGCMNMKDNLWIIALAGLGWLGWAGLGWAGLAVWTDRDRGPESPWQHWEQRLCGHRWAAAGALETCPPWTTSTSSGPGHPASSSVPSRLPRCTPANIDMCTGGIFT